MAEIKRGNHKCNNVVKAMKINTIRNKISLLYILFAVVILAVAGMVIDLEMESFVKQNVETNLMREIDLLGTYFQAANNIPPQDLTQRLADHLKKTQVRVTAIDSTGRVLVDSDIGYDRVGQVENHLSRPEIQLALIYGSGKDIRLSKSTNHEYFYVAKKVEGIDNASLSGLRFIRASLSLQSMNAELADVRWNIFMAGIIVLLLVFMLSSAISARIARPVKKIIQKVNEVSQGNYNLKIDVQSNDEIKVLSDSINKLTAKINGDMIELERLAKIRSQFLANVSHELRTPLFSIQAFIETLMQGAINDPEVNQKYLKKTLAHVDRLNFLLMDLIEISRIESGDVKLSFRYFPVSELFTQLGESFRTSCAMRNMTLEVAPAENVQVYGDKSRLLQVFSNLIGNAIKYNPDGTNIRVYFGENEASVSFFIEDNGIGIEEEHLPRLFERFYRIDKERSRETGGTGLGLAIVKHIVEAHGGSISVKSKPGQGTTFCFVLKK
jgi:two-component system, OmpR family, phosphate regulon sensor histidine kinase PhoR